MKKGTKYFDQFLDSLKIVLLVNQFVFVTGQRYKYFVGRFFCFRNFNLCHFSEEVINSFSPEMQKISQVLAWICFVLEVLWIILLLLSITQKLVKSVIVIVLMASVLVILLSYYAPEEMIAMERRIVDRVSKSLVTLFSEAKEV